MRQQTSHNPKCVPCLGFFFVATLHHIEIVAGHSLSAAVGEDKAPLLEVHEATGQHDDVPQHRSAGKPYAHNIKGGIDTRSLLPLAAWLMFTIGWVLS